MDTDDHSRPQGSAITFVYRESTKTATASVEVMGNTTQGTANASSGEPVRPKSFYRATRFPQTSPRR